MSRALCSFSQATKIVDNIQYKHITKRVKVGEKHVVPFKIYENFV